jgi:proteic killer suppression protein
MQASVTITALAGSMLRHFRLGSQSAICQRAAKVVHELQLALVHADTMPVAKGVVKVTITLGVIACMRYKDASGRGRRSLEVEFAKDELCRLERDASFTAGHGRDVVRGYRKAMQAIRAATIQNDLYRGGLRTEKLKGARQHQHSIRINQQWRLIVEMLPGNKIRIVNIEDYH